MREGFLGFGTVGMCPCMIPYLGDYDVSEVPTCQVAPSIALFFLFSPLLSFSP